MSKSNGTEMEQEKEIGSIVQQLIYRLPKNNHDAMVQLEKQLIDILKGTVGCVLRSFSSAVLRT
jgi:hypothetical protein